MHKLGGAPPAPSGPKQSGGSVHHRHKRVLINQSIKLLKELFLSAFGFTGQPEPQHN